MRFSVINIWLVLVSAALIGLPLTENFSSGIHPIDEKRLAQLALTLLGLSAVAFRPKLLNLHHPKHPFIVLIALSTLVLSCTLAYSPIMALLEASNLIAIALCCLVVANLENVSTAIIRIAAITAAVYVVVAISHLVTGVFLVADQSVILRLPGFTNIRFFSHWLTWTLPIIGALPLFHKHLANTPKYWLWTLACLWWFLFYMAAGRGTALAVTGSALLILVVAGRPAWAWFKTVSITAIAGNLIGVAFIAYEFNFFASSVHTDGGLLATSSSGRFGLWLTAWEIFLENPLFGVGTGHFAHIVPTGTTTPHNWPLMLLAENGAVTTLIIASAIALAFYKALKDAHRKPIEPEKLAFYSAAWQDLSIVFLVAFSSRLIANFG